MKKKYVIKRFLFGIFAILVAGLMIWIDYLVLVDQLPVGFLWITIPAVLMLIRISKDMDILSAVIEFTKEIEKNDKKKQSR